MKLFYFYENPVYIMAGLIGYDEDAKKLTLELPNKTWQIDNPMGNDAAKTVLKDSILYIAMYPVISDGSDVDAYNKNTGKLLWTGDVKHMQVAHSEYYNTVYLTLFHDKLILEGVEAGGQYLQVLDAKTGKRLFEAMP
jgi:outer membrane protein assembly factor BamB